MVIITCLFFFKGTLAAEFKVMSHVHPLSLGIFKEVFLIRLISRVAQSKVFYAVWVNSEYAKAGFQTFTLQGIFAS